MDQTVTHDGPHPVTASTVNTFQASLAVKAGTSSTSIPASARPSRPRADSRCRGRWGLTTFPIRRQPTASREPSTQIREPAKHLGQFDPSNDFGFAGLTKNKKKGQATVTVNLPGPGSATLTGAGVKGESASSDRRRRDVRPQGGSEGKPAEKLKGGGKAGVTVDVTFTPTGGSAGTKSESLKLVKKG